MERSCFVVWMYGRSRMSDRVLKIFADQAVIAFENAKLLTRCRSTRELSEALEQQSATADILGIISNSLTDTQPCSTPSCRAVEFLSGFRHQRRAQGSRHG